MIIQKKSNFFHNIKISKVGEICNKDDEVWNKYGYNLMNA